MTTDQCQSGIIRLSDRSIAFSLHHLARQCPLMTSSLKLQASPGQHLNITIMTFDDTNSDVDLKIRDVITGNELQVTSHSREHLFSGLTGSEVEMRNLRENQDILLLIDGNYNFQTDH